MWEAGLSHYCLFFPCSWEVRLIYSRVLGPRLFRPFFRIEYLSLVWSGILQPPSSRHVSTRVLWAAEQRRTRARARARYASERRIVTESDAKVRAAQM